jgi:hypothetical protein
MKTTKSMLAALVVILTFDAVSFAQRTTRRSPQLSPQSLVADLYRQHKKRSPFFQTTDRALLDRYFEKSLGDLIWKDAVNSKGEPGAIDGDPLFNAQDMDIKKFVIHGAKFGAPNTATVLVTFENLGKPNSVSFEMSKLGTGWRIRDMKYDDGSRLRTILEQNR